AQHQTDPSGADRDVRVGFLLGNATASARATAIDDIGPRPGRLPEIIDIPGTTTVIPIGGRMPDAGSRLPSRTVVVTETSAAPPIGARGAYGAVMLLAASLFLIRPLVRVASRP
ncbi:MAG: hypothetical protein ACREQJ_14920, partial [Candidatus Binatia bacterium]